MLYDLLASVVHSDTGTVGYHSLLRCLVYALQDTSVLYQYRYDWKDQFWAANILLATLTDGGTFHAQAQSFLKFWICGTDEVRAMQPLHPHSMKGLPHIAVA